MSLSVSLLRFSNGSVGCTAVVIISTSSRAFNFNFKFLLSFLLAARVPVDAGIRGCGLQGIQTG